MVSERANTLPKFSNINVDYYRLKKHKLVQRTRVPPRPKMPKRVKPPRVVPNPRRSHGPRLRLRKSLTTPYSSTKSNTREWLRRFQRFFASPEPFSARSSRLEDPLHVPLSRTCTNKAWSDQLALNTPVLTSIWDVRPKPPLRKLLLKLKRLPPKLRKASDDQISLVKRIFRNYIS